MEIDTTENINLITPGNIIVLGAFAYAAVGLVQLATELTKEGVRVVKAKKNQKKD